METKFITIGVAIPKQTKETLLGHVQQRRKESGNARYSLSDLLREILTAYLNRDDSPRENNHDSRN